MITVGEVFRGQGRTQAQQRLHVVLETDSDTPLPQGVLWFEWPESVFGHCEWKRQDGFLPLLTLLAMNRQEKLYLPGPVSPQLLLGVQQFQATMAAWRPDLFSVIPIEVGLIAAMELIIPSDNTALCFSGGVDSFYSLLTAMQRDYMPITHLLYMAGYDVPLSQEAVHTACEQRYHRLARDLNMTFLSGASNVRDTLAPIRWDWVFGTALASAALTLQPMLHALLIPSPAQAGLMKAWGSTGYTDPLFSTECLRIYHDANSATRLDKLKALVDWPLTYAHLRVCWQNPQQAGNCGQCEKCLRTMTSLLLLERLDRYETFPTDSRLLSGLWRTVIWSESQATFAKENLRLSIQQDRLELALPLVCQLMDYPIRRVLKQLARRL